MIARCPDCGSAPHASRETLDGQRVWVIRCCGERVECDDLNAAAGMWAAIPPLRCDVRDPHVLAGYVRGCVELAIESGQPRDLRAALARVQYATREAAKGAP